MARLRQEDSTPSRVDIEMTERIVEIADRPGTRPSWRAMRTQVWRARN